MSNEIYGKIYRNRIQIAVFDLNTGGTRKAKHLTPRGNCAFSIHFSSLQHKWFDIMNSATNDNIDNVLEYAIKTIPLAEISTGADKLMGLGKEYNLHGIVDYIVQSLDKYEGKGKAIILASLKSPVIRNRTMAIRTLDNWHIEYITQELRDAINDAEKVEPEEDVKERLSKLLARF